MEEKELIQMCSQYVACVDDCGVYFTSYALENLSSGEIQLMTQYVEDNKENFINK